MNAKIRNTLACSAALALAAVALPSVAQSVNAYTETKNQQKPVEDVYYTNAWNVMDTNHDGRVSRAEYLAYHSARWDSYDTGKRGYMDKSETRRLLLERELSKTDGTPLGDPSNPLTKK
jgi:hypothetical protein